MGKVIVIHPDLGLGGAERLIVDASKSLQDKGHDVIIYTGYHDKKRCFEETRNGTLKVETIGQWIPRSIMGRLHALIAYLKMFIIALYVLSFESGYDLVLCDQVSTSILMLKLGGWIWSSKRAKIVFYCHFPDQLLTSRSSSLKILYRKPLDLLEEWSTGLADVILVNSKFTSNVVRKTFKSLKNRDLQILYPCVNVTQIRNAFKHDDYKFDVMIRESNHHLSPDWRKGKFIFISLNRFERKKNLNLAIEALSECNAAIKEQEIVKEQGNIARTMKAHLIVAGGYDERLIDSVRYYGELKQMVDELKLSSYVSFFLSPDDKEKLLLLGMSDAVLYTPRNEHFGIVPIEAMALSRPVISCNSGGPLETVEQDVSGYLCDDDKYSFADAMLKLINDRNGSLDLGKAGYERVRKHFSYEAFRDKLNKICYPF